MKEPQPTSIKQNILVFGFSFITAFVFTFSFIMVLLVIQSMFYWVIPDPWIEYHKNYPPSDSASTYVEVYNSVLSVFETIGIVSLILLLIILGIAIFLSRIKLATSSAFILNLPVLCIYIFRMFFFAGTGVLYVLWLPLFNLSPVCLRLGEIFYLPITIFYILGEEISQFISGIFGFVIIILFILLFILGLMLFTYGVVTWIYGRFTGHQIVDFWLYRFSRHPQYTGFLLLFWYQNLFAGFSSHFWIPMIPTSTFFVLGVLFTIGLAIHEENQLLKLKNDYYLQYKNQTPFLCPIPRRISQVFHKINLYVLKKGWPETDQEIILLLGAYSLLIVLISLLLVLITPLEIAVPI